MEPFNILNTLGRFRIIFNFLYLTCLLQTYGKSNELTFELQDNDKQCFHELIEKGVKTTLEYQVIDGGNYDVDVEIRAPNSRVFYKEARKQYDTFTWTTQLTGVHQFCFSNEFSSFSHKTIYFDLQVGDDPPLAMPESADAQAHVSAMTQMESSSMSVHGSLKLISDFQTHQKLREAQGRAFAEDINENVQYWSLGQTFIILLVGVGQVMVLRSFFREKKQKSGLLAATHH